MKEENFELVNKLIRENEDLYGQEIRATYGDELVDRVNNYLKESLDLTHAREIEEKLVRQLENLILASESDQQAQRIEEEVFKLHKEWLTLFYPAYDSKYHLAMADMYEKDERFLKYYNDLVEGGSKYLISAIRAHAK